MAENAFADFGDEDEDQADPQFSALGQPSILDSSRANAFDDITAPRSALESPVARTHRTMDDATGQVATDKSPDPNDGSDGLVHSVLSKAGDLGYEAAKGLGGSTMQAAKALNIVAGGIPVMFDKAASLLSGEPSTKAQDAWFRTFVDPTVEHESDFAVDKSASFADKAAHVAGSTLGTIADAVITGGEPEEAAAAAAGVGDSLRAGIEHGWKSMTAPAVADAIDVGQKVYEKTGDGSKAILAAQTHYITSAAAGIVPLSAPGKLASRLVGGSAAGAASGEFFRQANNASLPEDMRTPFSGEDVGLGALSGAMMGGALGPRATEHISSGNAFREQDRQEPTISETPETPEEPKTEQKPEPEEKKPAPLLPSEELTALRAVRDQSAGPEHVNPLEDAGLVRTNDVGVPKMTATGKARLAELEAGETPDEPEKPAASKKPDPTQDTALEYLAKAGGVNIKEAETEGLDPADMKAQGVGIKRAFHQKGMTLESAGERLNQAGYPVTDHTGAVDKNKVIDLLHDELQGSPHYSVNRSDEHMEYEFHQAIPDFHEQEPIAQDFTRLTARAHAIDPDATERALEADDDVEAQRRLEAIIGGSHGTETGSEEARTGGMGERETTGEAQPDHAQETPPETQRDFTARLDAAREATHPEPTEGQKQAGNYAKGTLDFGGMKVAIENAKGSTRTGKTHEGKPFSRVMKHDYGYVKGTHGNDGDEVDTFLTGKPDTGKVFVINQKFPDTGKFDEHKAVLGADSAEEARKTYLSNYPKGWGGLGSLVESTTPAFKEWLKSGNTKEPFPQGDMRADTGRRKTVDAMSAEELRQELLTHELTGLQNRRAYKESEKQPAQVSIDVDSLKWVNDHMGHDSGDKLLQAVAASLKAHTPHAYHLSGDEFAVQAKHAAEAHAVMAQVAAHLKGAKIEVEMPDGKIVRLNGMGVSYGVGKTLHEADSALQSHKSAREASGERAARGESPPGASLGDGSEGREDSERDTPQTVSVRENAATYDTPKPAPGQVESPAHQMALQFYAPAKTPGPTAAAVKSIAATRLVETGRVTTGITKIDGWTDAAHLVAPFRKDPQESMVAVVTDKNRKVLSIIRHSRGTASASYVEPWSLVGAIAKVPGAADVYFAHNHPAGSVEQSQPDHMITHRLTELMRGSGVVSRGMIVVAPGNKEASFIGSHVGEGREERADIPPARRNQSVPVVERRFQKIGHGPYITQPEVAARYVEKLGIRSGLLMLSYQHEVVGVLPIDHKEMMNLRSGDSRSGTMRVLREIANTNSAAAVTFGAGKESLGNLGNMLEKGGVRVLDSVQGVPGTEAFKSIGAQYGSTGQFFRRTKTPGGMPKADVETLAKSVIDRAGLEHYPQLNVVDSHKDLPAHLAKQLEDEGATDTTGAIYEPRADGDVVHLLANNNASKAEVVENLLHEGAHAGLRRVLDEPTYNEVMDGLWKDSPERVQMAAERNGLDVNDNRQRRAAAEEVIAYAAGQHLAGREIDKPVLPWWRKVAQSFREVLHAAGIRKHYGDRKIAELIQQSHQALQNQHDQALRDSYDPLRHERAAMFYSPVERTVANMQQGRASGDQWKAAIEKSPGIKAEELDWLGIKDWLGEQKGPVTKDRVLEYIRANQLHLEETTLGDEGTEGADERRYTELQEKVHALGYSLVPDEDGRMANIEHYGRSEEFPVWESEDFANVPAEIRGYIREMFKIEQRQRDAEEMGHAASGAKYGDYTLPGGENYREMLLRLPAQDSPNRGPTGWGDTAGGTEDDANFHSGHFAEPNILAHVRFKDRLDTEGKKTLFLEELQSDWHQQGRKRGYRSELPPEDRARLNALDRNIARIKEEGVSDEDRAQYFTPGAIVLGYGGHDKVIAYHPQDGNRSWSVEVIHVHPDGTPVPREGIRNHATSPADEILKRAMWERNRISGARKVPDAPFKTNWPSLLMKRMIRHAAEGGYDRIGWTTGEQQAERYNLERSIRSVTSMYHEGADRPYQLRVRDAAGARIVDKPHSQSEMEDLLGKELSDKIVAQSKENPYQVLEGLNLRTGGEGMKGFYDKMLPGEVGKLIKKYGGKVGEMRLRHPEHEQMHNYLAGGGAHVVPRLGAFDVFSGAAYSSSFDTREDAQEHADHINAVDRASESATGIPAHGFDITPEMRDAALNQGFPMFARRPQMDQQQPLTPKKRKFFENVHAAARAIIEAPVVRDVRKLISPVNLTPESRATARVAREALGNLAHSTHAAQEGLEKFSKMIDLMSPKDQLQMMDDIEHGRSQANPELQPVADAMRKLLDTWRDKVRGLGTGALDSFIENYFPHYWQDPGKASRLMASIVGRRPLRGPATFLKMRTIPTIKEGMDAGLRPLTINPLVMTLLKAREMQRYISGVKMMEQLKNDGLARFLASGKPTPEGWKEIDDNIARIRQWSDVEKGFIDRGRYIMPEDAARVINNHLSASALQNFAPAQIFRMGSNALNALQLGFSAFHLGFTTLDAVVSKNALALERLMHGEPLKAAAAFAEGATLPGAAIANIVRGHKLMRAYADPSGATPEMQKVVNALIAAGGKVKMDRYFQMAQGVSPFRGVGVRSLANDIHQAMTRPSGKVTAVASALGHFAPEYATRLWRDLQGMAKTYPKFEIPFEIAGRVARASTSWIMEHVVPMQKLGVFSDLARDAIRRDPTMPPEKLAAHMQKAWDSVDNRLGEMVYDNLFWNRTFKDTMHFAIRAVGWNTGTLREIGGAPLDILKAADKLATEGKITADDIGHKLPYVMGLTMTAATIGAITNYLFTGEPPKELKDYFFPRTGGVTSYGTPERVSLPSYIKDIYEYSQRPGRTLLNKLNPIFNIIGEMWSNEDFFGRPISDPAADAWPQFKQKAAFVASEATPFSLQGRQQLQGSEKPGPVGTLKSLLPMVGVAPAPGYVTSQEQIERRQKYEDEQKYTQGLKYRMRDAMKKGDKASADRLRQEYITSKHAMHAAGREVHVDKAKAARARHDAALTLRQAGHPAMATLMASLPLQPDRSAREFFATEANKEV